ncbi:MAG: peptidyl-prolyl cis-trans isomerase [Planctomycetota bacterium]|nr:peptidyl-prolyl cis-trans isomerase [Planctomycetaceae bacterium]MDQ3333033.1 peptidyl-prolyl cis-trans isomerase [Planctomycetota bacterium]
MPQHDRTRLCRGRLCRAALASALIAGGCESWKSAKVDHPVLGPPPPRLSQQESLDQGVAVADASGESISGYVKVSLSEPSPISDHAVVAIVNGRAILAGQILAPFRPYYVGKPDFQAAEIKKAIIEKQLDTRIDEVLLVQSLELMLKPEQLKQIDEKLDEEFDKESRKIMAGLKVNSKIEAEQMLSKQSTSLAEFEQAFKRKQLATLYMQEKMGSRVPIIGRHEILEYYNANIANYEHPARAQFQLLSVSFDGKRDKAAARATLDEALAALAAGEPFPDVAKKFSDGPQASRGGQWDWLKPGEYADANVDQALFTLPIGEPSGVFETANAFVVVKVTNREAAGRTPVTEVQDAIRTALLNAAQENAANAVLAELRDKAVITKYIE